MIGIVKHINNFIILGNIMYFQDIVATLSSFWSQHGCLIVTPYDVEKGAGTSNPATLLRALGPEPFSAAYIEPCRRPKDGRYGTNPNRTQHYFQFQTILKPSPDDIVDIYLESLKAIGLDLSKHDIRFVHDDWENPTVGAWGLGWEVWLNGMEITQFTYFQAAAGLSLPSITGEITYGIERIALYLQNVDSFFKIKWNEHITYGDLFLHNEQQWSKYNFEDQDDHMWMRHFEDFVQEAKQLLAKELCIPAYDFVLKASHAFNMLDAKGVISVSERASYIARIRDLAKEAAVHYLAFRERIGYPLLTEEQATPQPQKVDLSDPKNPKERFVLEIGTEELPATFVPIGIQQLERAFTQFLQKEGLTYSSLRAVGAPRRLAIIIEDLITEKPSTSLEKRGPKVEMMWDENGNPTRAGEGFLQSLSLPLCTKSDINKIPELSIRKIKNIEYVVAHVQTAPQKTSHILHSALPTLIRSLEFPKMMRWGNHSLCFARPIRWILSLLGDDIVPFSLEHILSGRTTQGHRQLSPKTLQIPLATDYECLLEENFVLVDQKKRLEKLSAQIDHIESSTGLSAVQKAKVMPQLLHLSEWPQAVDVSFDAALLQAPKEVLISEMVEHQKYLPLVDQKGVLQNHFIIVADNNPSNLIKQGNIKVLSARLADGDFLWREDVQIPLSKFREKLKTIIYQRDLGTLWQKSERLETLVRSLHSYFPQANLDACLHAAQLAKADLATQVVSEFPELQGKIGELLAREQNLPNEIATAIYEHWLPLHEKDALPQSAEGMLLSLADRLDTLCGFFSVNLLPTSSSDPYALRRQAIGLIRIALTHHIHLSFHELFARTLNLFTPENREQTIQALTQFAETRAKMLFVEMGYKRDLIDALNIDDPYDALLKLTALDACKECAEEFAAFLEVLKRCYGQADLTLTPSIDPSRFKDASEKDLYSLLQKTEHICSECAQKHDWKTFLDHLIHLRQPIDTLFCQVKILADDPILRTNRLSLLSKIISLCSYFADGKKLIASSFTQKENS